MYDFEVCTCAKVKGHLCATGFLCPPLCGFQGSHSGLQALVTRVIPTVPYCCPYLFFMCPCRSQVNLSCKPYKSILIFKQVPFWFGVGPHRSIPRASLSSTAPPVFGVQAQATKHLDLVCSRNRTSPLLERHLCWQIFPCPHALFSLKYLLLLGR